MKRHAVVYGKFFPLFIVQNMALLTFGKLDLPVIPEEQYTAVGKETGKTAHMERWKNTLRQRLARFVRKTLSFSKSLSMHDACLRLFLHRYNRERAAILIMNHYRTSELKEVKELLKELKAPVQGVISDGEETIGSAVALRLPRGAPSTLSVSRAFRRPPSPSTKPIDMPKQSGSKHVPGVRPLERALEERSDPEAEAIRGYCLAVRSALTDDGRSPLQACGLKLQDRLTQVRDSIARVEQKKLPPALKHLRASPHQGVAAHRRLVVPSQECLCPGASGDSDFGQ